MLKSSVKRKFVGFSSLLFVFLLLVDPGNSILGLKMPSFLLFVLSLALCYKPNTKYIGIIVLLIIMHGISLLLGIMGGVEMDNQIGAQYFLFYLLLIVLFWDSNIDLVAPLTVSCLAVSLITIIGFVAMQSFPILEELLYQFSQSHNEPFFMAHRNFLGMEFVSFFYRTLPVVMIPAAIRYEKFLFERRHKLRNLLLVAVYLISLFCGGNRTMLLGIFAIIVVMTYPKVKHLKIIRLFIFFAIVIGVYIAYLAITDTDSESSDIKFGHIESYIDLISEHWEYLLFGMGPGGFFYSKGAGGLISITEWTYLEIIRMYGLFGLVVFSYLLLSPLFKHNNRKYPIKYWRSISWSYVFFLISCMSNPYLIGSTGLVCITFIYSIVNNPKFKICRA